MKSAKFHYAWVICAACTLLIICNMGLCSNILSVYLPFLKQNGLSSEQGSAILSIRCFASFLSVFLVPWYYGKLSLRNGAVISTLFGAAAAVIFSVGANMAAIASAGTVATSAGAATATSVGATTAASVGAATAASVGAAAAASVGAAAASSGSSFPVAIYFIAAAFAGIAYGIGAVIPASLLISAWFVKHKGLAMGISSAGTGMATIVFPPVLTSMIQKSGLAFAFRFQAIFIVVSAVLIFFLLKDSPAMMGYQAYGAGEKSEKIRTRSGTRDLTPFTWVLMIIVVLASGGCGLASCGHLPVLATSCGYTVETVALITSIYGVMLMLSKFLFGGIADRVGTKTASILFFLIFIAGCLFALLLDGTAVFKVILMSAFLGFGSPIFAVGIPLWAIDFSTPASYPRTLKWFQILYSGGGILFNLIPGFISGRTGEYISSYVFFAVTIIVCLVLLLMTYRIMTER